MIGGYEKYGRKAYVRNRLWIQEYLTNHPCVDCGESDPIVLEFDHIDPSLKIRGITQVATNSSLETLQEEVEKCEVWCANCHRRKTAKQLGHYQYLENHVPLV